MFVRSILFVFIVASVAHAQLERFAELQELGKWAAIARVSTDFEEFKLTSEQYDKLKVNEVENGNNIYSFGAIASGDGPEQFLKTVYEVFSDEQEQRLHQIMFQRWMNRDDLPTALGAFADGEVKDLGAKVEKLNAEIDQRREEVIAALPERQNEHLKPLAEFMKWRWERQTSWLKDELGDKRMQELIGTPVTQSFQFVTKGDAATAGTDGFGGPVGGGSYFGGMAGSYGHSGDGINNVYTATASYNPSDGTMNGSMQSRRRKAVRPVDIPKGMTVETAKTKLAEIKQAMQAKADEYAPQIGTLQNSQLPGGLQRAAYEEANELGALLEKELGVLQVQREKVRAMVTKLGGDPDAEAKAIRAAQSLFYRRPTMCDQQPFVSHIKANAEQCDKFDAIADEFGTGRLGLPPEKEEAYFQAVMAVLDKEQQKRLKQQRFRSDWYSENCARAFSFTKIKLTDSQVTQLRDLGAKLEQTQQDIQDKQMAEMRQRHFGGLMRYTHRFGLRDHLQYSAPFVDLKKEFDQTLASIVGKATAKKLLSQPMKYDPNWKRPVNVPKGLTLPQAKQRYAKLAAESQALEDRLDALMEADFDELPGVPGLDPGLDPFGEPSEEEQIRQVQLQRELVIAQRIVEELGGTAP